MELAVCIRLTGDLGIDNGLRWVWHDSLTPQEIKVG